MGTRNATAPEPSVGGLPVEGYVRLPQILAVYPISRSGWWAGVKSGRYPASVKLGPRTTAWRAADIRRLLSEQPSAPAPRSVRN
jgi:prophage regulatory protein